MRGGMRLAALAKEVAGATVVGSGDPLVRDVRVDSRLVEPGDLFVALPGARTDGSRFVGQAIDRGAVAVVRTDRGPLPVPTLVVPDARDAVGPLAAAVHGRPTEAIPAVGITGTNGKTTTSYLVAAAVGAAGGRPARFGTLGASIGGAEEEMRFTTPEADEVHRLAARAVRAGDTVIVMEVSSHALHFRRVGGVRFRVAAFTNLTQDHLDLHGDLESYFLAKRRLFLDHRPDAAIVAVDDEWGRRLAAEIPGVATVSTDPRSRADFRPVSVALDMDGLRGTVTTPGGEVELVCPLVGRHNLQNALVALAVSCALGVDGGTAARGFESVARVPGRLEPAEAPPGVRVFVDYSHTPDALRRALEALRPVTPGRLLCVFGCGGDRDPTKRAPMGETAARGADVTIATTDNPRTEAPLAILEAIRPGLVASGRSTVDAATLAGTPEGVHVEPDRRRAIALAIEAARPGDVVLVAGKGHETYQIVGTEKLPFDDREEVAAATYALERPSGDAPTRWVGTAGSVARETGGLLAGGEPGLHLRGVSTDSRTLAPGSVFFALSGPHFDGHGYLEGARLRGARLAVVRRDAMAPVGLPLVRVEDPLLALAALARAHVERWRSGDRKVVAITGSAGKTTTKELCAAALGVRTLKTLGNLNNLVGLPMTALRLDGRIHDFAVMELGTNAPGEIARLADVVRPDVAVVTHAAVAHTEGLGSLEAVAREKASLWTGLREGGTAVVNADDSALLDLAPDRHVSFGRSAGADVRIAERKVRSDGTEVELRTPAGTVHLSLRLLGPGAAEDAAAAVAVAVVLGVDPSDVADRLASVAPLQRRLELRRASAGHAVLDDSYNANPRSTRAALATLAEIAEPADRIVVLGDMLELGAQEQVEHENVGRLLAETGVELAVLCGSRMAAAGVAARGAGMEPARIVVLPGGEGAADVVRPVLRTGSVVLVKASRGMRLDLVADSLVGEGVSS